ncbi:uncharacterized protein LOC126735753 [Anthonomus grandis grandis]|uniref:uncharacterized protein LOC126735753 n=1 Tax=Anthonomus grandis grandis TaxID=2921223 RepID=UPI00216620DF|nr:uncharacterized protein LOC126735753 [Anthonomus grandis grandis]
MAANLDPDDIQILNQLMSEEQIETERSKSHLNKSEFDFEFDCQKLELEDEQDEEEDNIFEDDYQMVDYITNTDLMTIRLDNPQNFLTEAESQLLASCTDPLLKEVAILNRKKNIQLIHYRKQMKLLLEECQASILQYQRILISKQPRVGCSRLWRIGMPFFKTSDDFPCPRNPDLVRKEQRRELLFYDLISYHRWIPRDMVKLKKWVSFHYKLRRETDLLKRINELKNSDNKEQMEEIVNLEVQLEKLKNNKSELCPALGCEDALVWKDAECLFTRASRHTGEECRNIWTNYIHPDINTGAWSSEEDKKLRQLTKEFKCQNWDEIAKRLGTKRTGFLVCQYYFRVVEKPIKTGRFSEEEDQMLRQLVDKHKQPCKEGIFIPWAKIAAIFLTRSREQLFFRYKYYLCNDTEENKEGFNRKFTQAEDLLLMVLVDRFGKKFTQIEKYFPQRTSMALKSRHSGYLGSSSNKKGGFILEDDQQILDYVAKNGTVWAPLAKIIRRTSTQTRQRYNVLMNYIREQGPDYDLANAPRRVFHADTFFCHNNEFLRSIADTFKMAKHIPTLEEVQLALAEAREDKKRKETRFKPVVAKTYSRTKGQPQIRTYQKGINNCQKLSTSDPIKSDHKVQLNEGLSEVEPLRKESSTVDIDLPKDVQNCDRTLIRYSTIDTLNADPNVVKFKEKGKIYRIGKAVNKDRSSKINQKNLKVPPTKTLVGLDSISSVNNSTTLKPQLVYQRKTKKNIVSEPIKTEKDQRGHPLAFQTVFIPGCPYLSINEAEVDPLAVDSNKPIEPREILLHSPKPQLNSRRKAESPIIGENKKLKGNPSGMVTGNFSILKGQLILEDAQKEMSDDLKELKLMEEFLKKEKESVEEDVFEI